MGAFGGIRMKVLITGITGFAGSHLAELYLKEGADVHGTIRWRSDMSNIRDFADQLTLHNCDIRDAYSVAKTVEEVKPEFIHHLAAQTFVLESWRAPQETLSTNIMGTLNILEAARKHPCIVHLSGSSEEYGAPILPADLPITEEQKLQPVSPYAVSKVAADMLAVQYAKSYGIKVVVTRAFNHTGPRRGEVFVTSTFAKQIARILAGKQESVIEHGNLEAIRDFTDVRDIVIGYFFAAQYMIAGSPTAPLSRDYERFNLCSGEGRSMMQVLQTLLDIAGIKGIRLREDPKRMRPSDVPILIGSNQKAREKLRWSPVIPFEATMKDLLEYWKERV